jgi:hypothetical protein
LNDAASAIVESRTDTEYGKNTHSDATKGGWMVLFTGGPSSL